MEHDTVSVVLFICGTKTLSGGTCAPLHAMQAQQAETGTPLIHLCLIAFRIQLKCGQSVCFTETLQQDDIPKLQPEVSSCLRVGLPIRLVLFERCVWTQDMISYHCPQSHDRK